jgi:hypothetical protein
MLSLSSSVRPWRSASRWSHWTRIVPHSSETSLRRDGRMDRTQSVKLARASPDGSPVAKFRDKGREKRRRDPREGRKENENLAPVLRAATKVPDPPARATRKGQGSRRPLGNPSRNPPDLDPDPRESLQPGRGPDHPGQSPFGTTTAIPPHRRAARLGRRKETSLPRAPAPEALAVTPLKLG